MKVIVTTQNRSLTEFGVLYVGGEVHDVDDVLGAKLCATGRMGRAILPPPKPDDDKLERATALISKLAALPDNAFGKLERLLDFGGDEAVTELAEAAEADEPVVVTNDEPRTVEPVAVANEEPRTIAPVDDDDDLEDMTVHQLRAMAKDRGVDLGKRYMPKAGIIKALRGI